jgi:hypothetical protein
MTGSEARPGDGPPTSVAPMLAVAGQPPEGPGWGFRVQASRCVAALGGGQAAAEPELERQRLVESGCPRPTQPNGESDRRPQLHPLTA